MMAILDTNALMIPGQFGVDIFSELERLGYDRFIVPRQVVCELKSLYEKGGNKVEVSVALSLLDRCEVVDAKGLTDDTIVQTAGEMNAAVVTIDAELRKRLKDKGITTICLRQKKRLDYV
ncbi:MAG: DNA-binding protein [Methanocellales archaeon]|nr:DNA-binding protein [Methanocellales archaeon]MDD3421776.1 DNA-binding protein [Methanocellales archaeon]MDD4898559.1 DNA-binding protein [Methanocellales archaeon]MDD5447126.1 DNA-binding protein [Methanocellales archaeon]